MSTYVDMPLDPRPFVVHTPYGREFRTFTVMDGEDAEFVPRCGYSQDPGDYPMQGRRLQQELDQLETQA